MAKLVLAYARLFYHFVKLDYNFSVFGHFTAPFFKITVDKYIIDKL